MPCPVAEQIAALGQLQRLLAIQDDVDPIANPRAQPRPIEPWRKISLRLRVAFAGCGAVASKLPRSNVANARASSRSVLICASAIRRVL